jgi:hypothetical protein
MVYSAQRITGANEEVEINDAFSDVFLDIFQDDGFRTSLSAVQAHGAAGFALDNIRPAHPSAVIEVPNNFGRSDAADFIARWNA